MTEFLFEGAPIGIEEGETVLNALLRSGIEIEHACKAGACQSCLLRSSTPVAASAQNGLDPLTASLGGFLSCQAKAMANQEVSRFDASFFPSYEGKVVSKEMLATDICRIEIDVPGFVLCPGRFIQLIHPSGIKRPYSVATSMLKGERLVEIHVRLLPNGQMSQLIAEAKVGDLFTVQGPFGKCAYDTAMNGKDLLLIGSGTGLAPLLAIAADALARKHSGHIWLYHGGAIPEYLYLHQQLRSMDTDFANFHYVGCVDEGEGDHMEVGSPLDVALKTLVKLDRHVVFLCGHPGLVRAAQKQCFLAGASMKDIHADPFEANS
ncbi:MAG TPA: 2Fe-2S iron-sulfur cluster binding domain-containing protein [Fimbriimonas sp.]|nr:2Fe-2S iron-sulfur cluster binding domain-containing protein [Fimbriimonas sp.]